MERWIDWQKTHLLSIEQDKITRIDLYVENKVPSWWLARMSLLLNDVMWLRLRQCPLQVRFKISMQMSRMNDKIILIGKHLIILEKCIFRKSVLFTIQNFLLIFFWGIEREYYCRWVGWTVKRFAEDPSILNRIALNNEELHFENVWLNYRYWVCVKRLLQHVRQRRTYLWSL